MIRQKDIMSYISSLDGSPSSFFSSLTYRAVDDLYPDNHLPIVCGMQHSFRKALGKPFSHLCHVNIVPVIYPNRLRGRNLERLNTITRGSVLLRYDDANDVQTINRHIIQTVLRFKIIELVFSIFPKDLITPFLEGNTLQIIS